MRLQLTWLAALVVALSIAVVSEAHSDQRAATWLSVYSDNDALTVISPQLSVRGDLSEEFEISAGYEVDVISAATVDVLTAASPRGYKEERHGLSVGLLWTPEPETKISAKYIPSWEIDYRSHSLTAGVSREWLDRRLTTTLNGSVGLNRVGRSGSDTSTFRDLSTVSLGIGIGWIASRWTVLEAVYEPQWLDGFMASPYRFVEIQWTGGSSVMTPEAVPDHRLRHAIGFGVRHALTAEWFLSGKYRLYNDSWGVLSNTAEAELQRALAWDKLILGLSMRGYRQSKADFHKERYERMSGLLPEYRSADKMLAGSWSALAAARAQVNLGSFAFVDALRVTLKYEIYDQHFQEFRPLRRRIGQTGSLGASADF